MDAHAKAEIERITDRLADLRGGDYTYDQLDAGYYTALDHVRAAAGLDPTDRSKRGDGMSITPSWPV